MFYVSDNSEVTHLHVQNCYVFVIQTNVFV